MKNKFFKQIVTIFLFGILLFIVACTPNTEAEPKDKNVTTIKTVLERSFTGPDQELKELWSGIESDDMEDTRSSLKALDEYTKKRLKPYFTDDGFKEYSYTFGFTFLKTAYWNDYQLTAKNINVEQSEIENIYDFSLEVAYQKDGNDKKVATVTGEANMDKNGQIAVLLIRNNGLWEQLKQ